MSSKIVSKKIILIGGFGVGKTSLISRFVYQHYSEVYQTTIGVRMHRKLVEIGNIGLNMIIWDIEGEEKQSRIPETYYLGSSGAIYVFDLSRAGSFSGIEDDIAFLRQKLGEIPLLIVGNKMDLFDEDTLENVKKLLPVSAHFYASAKANQNVENIFFTLAQSMLNDR